MKRTMALFLSLLLLLLTACGGPAYQAEELKFKPRRKKQKVSKEEMKKLAELEKAGKLKAVITQNIDNLHQMAGSRKVLELHGSVYRNYCMRCGKFYDFSYVKNSTGVPYCECGGVVKPDVVLYEEMLDSTTLAESVDAISRAQVLIIGGTSLAVYPAASLIDYFRGEAIVVINKAPTPRDRSADLLIKDPIGQVFSQIRTEGE